MPRSAGLWRLILSLLLVMGVAITTGCGYALAGRGSYLPSRIKTVGIPPIENRTSFTGVERILTDRIRNEFISRGKFAIVLDTNADAVLRGELVSFSYQTAGVNQQQRASRYLVTIVLKVSFIDMNPTDKANEVLWSNDALTFRDEYEFSLSGGVEGAAFVDQQRTTVERIASDAARTVVTAILEAF